jgi:hypothetical protein
MADPNSSPPADRGSALIAAAILGAGLVISWGMSSSEPRYQLAASGDMVVRMDTDSGELIACNQQRCARVEPPDRAKTFGPLTVQLQSKGEPALPSSNAAAKEAVRE